jgi:hypothetical protein
MGLSGCGAGRIRRAGGRNIWIESSFVAQFARACGLMKMAKPVGLVLRIVGLLPDGSTGRA